jgi:pantetheine-phosphate adenylyltransferase
MIAVYAGRFDPVTNGHLDIVRRASRIFDRVIMAVYDAPVDKTLFPTNKRVSMLATCIQDMASVDVEAFDGLLTDFVRSRGAEAIVRGLRAVDDFSAEFDQALMYKDMAPEIEQVYLMSDLVCIRARHPNSRSRGSRPRRLPPRAKSSSCRAARTLAAEALAQPWPSSLGRGATESAICAKAGREQRPERAPLPGRRRRG